MKRKMTRRFFLPVPALAIHELRAQMASRDVKPTPRGKPSGLPFLCRFQDVGRAAGLKEPVIFGNPTSNTYIIESIGCGAAFFDYDNDGWMEIFLLSGRRLEGNPPDATNRL